jgi:hypothetical protein
VILDYATSSNLTIMPLLRVLRVLRIIKLIPKAKGLQVGGQCVRTPRNEPLRLDGGSFL